MGDQLKAIVMIQQHDYDMSDQDSGSRDREKWTDSRYILKGGSIELTDGIDGNIKKIKRKRRIVCDFKIFGLCQ